MRIGVLADIHGHVDNLTKAIDRLRREKVERFVVLGDLIYSKTGAAETVDLLRGCDARGVWGNHELGLCVDPSDELRQAYSAPVADYFRTLSSRYEIDDILFSHTLPDQDASDPTAYYLAPRPHEDGALTNCFSQFQHRLMFAGHFHRWFAADAEGPLDWQGGTPLQFENHRRYFCVIHAVMDGWTAVIDQQLDVLTPIRL